MVSLTCIEDRHTNYSACTVNRRIFESIPAVYVKLKCLKINEAYSVRQRFPQRIAFHKEGMLYVFMYVSVFMCEYLYVCVGLRTNGWSSVDSIIVQLDA